MQQSHFFYEIRVGDILLAKAVGGQLIDHLSQEADNTENDCAEADMAFFLPGRSYTRQIYINNRRKDRIGMEFKTVNEHSLAL